MKLIKRLWTVIDYAPRNWYYEGVDEYHWLKWRIGIKTAWGLAKILYP